ncbi:MAG TPA: HAMP domain-containing sensor histidine kinase [Methylomirabilota bacterium]|nr:HAMP domain-containing sensor histidine kinase [Methylomirabilota bacterium]
MRLATKIFLVSALVILVLCGTVVWSLLTVKRLVSANQEIATRAVPALRLQGALREAVQGLVRLEARALVLQDQDYAAMWSDRATRVTRDLEKLGSYVERAEERTAHRRAREAFATYCGHVKEERRLVALGQTRAALQIAEGPAREAAERAEAALIDATAATEAGLAAGQARARALEARTWRAVTAALVASLLLALSASAVLAYRMARSLGRLSAATTSLAAGSWTGPLVVTGRDEISELGRAFNQMAERLSEVERLKEEFFSHISHDLRNPLAAIRLSAEALQERAQAAGDPKQARFAYLIDTSAARMMVMINQILDFTRLRARTVPLDRKPTDLLHVITRALDELRPMSEEKRIRVDLAAEGHTFTVLGDEGSLVRVVVNLLGNALHFTPSGGAVRARLAELPDRLELDLEDTGVGIPADALPWIFEPYRQAHGQQKGTGLGLAVVKGLVEAQGGTVGVRSEAGKGSCFTVTLPKAPAAVGAQVAA